MERKRYILSSETLNRNGYRVLSSGIKVDNFLKNPVLLFGHNTWDAPIGKIDDIKMEGTTLTGVPVFDDSDPIGAGFKSKAENGFPFALSIGFRPLTLSSDPAHIIAGQQYETVTECELLEVSVVSIPANPDAVGLSANSETPIPALTKTHIIRMEKTTKALGLDPNATDDDIFKKVSEMALALAELQAKQAEQEIEQVLQLGIDKGMVNDQNRETYRKLAAADLDSVSTIFTTAPAPKVAEPQNVGTPRTLSAQLRPAAAANERDSWTFDDWSKKDPNGLYQLKMNDNAKYKKLAAEYK